MTLQNPLTSNLSASIHFDPPENRRPLPVVESSAPSPNLAPERLPFEHCTAIRAGHDRWTHLRLKTDSKHLSDFFSHQWRSDPCSMKPDATMYALVNHPEYYGVSPEFSRQRTWFRDFNEVWQFGTEYYGNIKVTVRGLCAALAEADELFLHGCALQVGTLGLIMSGTSGAGKSTLAASIRKLTASRTRVVNDDWGAVSLSQGRMFYTGEHRLHMKFRSVALLRPDLCPDPARYPTENYANDPEDAHARLLIPRVDVFGTEGVADIGPLSAYIVLFRDSRCPFTIRPIKRDDLMRIEEGEYSAFYRRHESFLDGALFLTSADDMMLHRAKLERLTGAVPAWVVNNVGSPSATARAIIETVHSQT